MPNVTKVEPNAKRPEWRTVTVGEKDFIVFSAELADALKIDAPLPEGTTEEPPKFDGALPSLRLPRGKGFGGAPSYRNSKEAFDAEQAGRRRWQEVEEDRKDRRTALMQAVFIGHEDWPLVAEEMYQWLKPSPVAGGLSQAPALDPGDSSSGEAQNPPGRDAGQPSPGPSPPSSAIGETATASVQGEVADAGPGGQSNPPGSTKTYPFDPATCTHKMPSGRWMRWDKDDRCPKCGTPKVSAVEGTTADLSA